MSWDSFKNFFKIKKSAQKNGNLDQKDVDSLRQQKIDEKIIAIHRSTRTTVPQLIALHDYCRMNWSWYYRWHLNPYASKFHIGMFLVIIAVCSLAIFAVPKRAEAADYSCTFTAATNNNWNDATNWDNCNSEYPGQTEATSYAVDIPTGKTASLNVDGLNLNNADNTVLGNISVTGTFTTNNNSITFGSMTINTGGTVNAGSSILNVYDDWSNPTTGGGTFVENTSTVNLMGSGTFSNGNADTKFFYNLNFPNDASKTTTMGGTSNDAYATNSINLGTGTIDTSSSYPWVGISGTTAAAKPIVNPGFTNVGHGFSLRWRVDSNIQLCGGNFRTISIESLTTEVTFTMTADLATTATDAQPAITGVWSNNRKSILDMNGFDLDTSASNVAKPLMIGNASNNTYNGAIINSSVTKSTLTTKDIYIYTSGASTVNELQGNNIDINVKGNWTNDDTFTAGDSTVTLQSTSADQTITTSANTVNNTFNNLTINNTGASGSDDILLSGTLGLDINSKLTITDGDLSPAAFNTTVAGGLEFTHATNGSWDRSGGGTLTFDGSGSWVDAGTTKRDLGAMTIDGAAATLTLGSSAKATSITIAADDILNLGAGSYTLELSGTGTPLTATGTFDKGTGSIVKYSATSGSNTVTNVNYNSLTIDGAGGSFVIGAPLDIEGTFTLTNGVFDAATNSMTIGGGWAKTGGTLNNIGAVTFDGGAGTYTVNSGGSAFGAFAHSGAGTLQPTAALNIDGTFTQGAGVLDLDTSDPTLNIAGNITINGGSVTKSSTNAAVTFDGDLTYDDNVGTINFGDIAIGTSPDTTELASDLIADSLAIATGDRLNTNGYDLDIGGDISITGTLDTTDDVEVDGTNINVAGNFTVNPGGVFTKDVTGTRSKIIPDGGATKTLTSVGNDLGDIQTSTASTHIDLQDNLTMGNLLIDASTTFDLNTASRTLTATDIHINGTLTATTTSTINDSGGWDNVHGTFTASTGTLIMSGNGTMSNTSPASGGKKFYNLNIAASGTITVSAEFWIDNYLNFISGTLNGNQQLVVYNPTSNLAFTNAGITYGASKPIVVLNTSSTDPASPGLVPSPANPYPDLYIKGNTGSGINYFKLNDDITVNGNMVLYSNQGTGKVTLNTNNGVKDCNITINNGGLTVGLSAIRTAEIDYNSSTIDLTSTTSGSVTIVNGASFNNSKLVATSGTIKVGKNWTNSDTFTAGTGTVEFNAGVGITQSLNSGGTGATKIFNNILHSGAGTLQLSSNNLNVDGNLTNSTGTFDTNSRDVTVAGNFNNTGGSFTPGTRTVTLDGAAAQQFIAGGTGAGKTLYNLTITNASVDGVTFNDSLTLDAGGTFADNTPNSKLTFHETSAYTFPNFDIDGAVGQRITLVSSNPGTAWLLNVAAAVPTVTYVNVSDSDASGGSQIIANDGTSLDSGGNTNWLLNHGPINDSLTFTNPYAGAGNTVVADDTTEWAFQAKVTDTDGPTNLNYVELRLANASDSALPYDSLKFRWTEGGLPNPFSEVADTQNAATITSVVGDATSAGNQWTLNFKVKLNNNFLDKDTQYHAELYSVDDVAWSDDDDYTNFYQVTSLSLTLSFDSATVSFGDYNTSGPAKTASTIATVTTNYPSGYVLQISDGVPGNNSALLNADGITRIIDYSGTIAAPTAWSSTGLGFCVFAATAKDVKWGTGTTASDANNRYAGIPEAATTINTKVGSPTVNDQTSVGYKLDVTNAQKDGAYNGNVTYTATGVL